jgi:hypothetical protein
VDEIVRIRMILFIFQSHDEWISSHLTRHAMRNPADMQERHLCQSVSSTDDLLTDDPPGLI